MTKLWSWCPIFVSVQLQVKKASWYSKLQLFDTKAQLYLVFEAKKIGIAMDSVGNRNMTQQAVPEFLKADK